MRRWILFGVFLAPWLSPSVLAEVFDLSGLKWTLKNRNGTIQIPASGPPSQAHLDLMNSGIITEPLLGVNDFTERWVVDENWTYSADISPFLKSDAFRNAKQTLLVFYGIDTIANITLAGHPVAWVNNQFRQYIFDVSNMLDTPKDNQLVVALESAWAYGLNVTARPDAEFFPNGNGVRTMDNFEYPGVRQWIRKIASDFGWDWGPAFVPSGIHKPAYLVTLASPSGSKESSGTPPISPGKGGADSSSPIFIEESSIDIYKLGQSFSVAPDESADWFVNVSLALRSSTQFKGTSLTLSFPELGIAKKFDTGPVNATSPQAGAPWVNALWRIPDSVPQRWYPHNLGTPKLYNMSSTLVLQSPSSTETVSFTTLTGFRTIQLVQAPYTDADVRQQGITPGDQWHFNINGKAFYALGTNIIPFDPFYARTTTDQVRWVLESAVKSGQNMLRIWGGGTYQPSDSSIAGGVYDFYSICDELGILAWSELIFSDSLYPINEFLLDSIEPEVRQNVRRVNKHPSNAQWAGGNEIEGIVTTVFVTLFQDFLQGIVSSETRSVPYTDCSTTNGVLSLDPYVLRLNNGTPGEIYGNSERYNYDATQAFNYSTFPVSRFVNEFGFHSMPSFYSWEEVLTSSEDFSFNSTVVMSRDHHPPAGNLNFPNPNAPQGQAQMTEAVQTWLPAPSTADSNRTFAQWCWSTQVFQNLAMVSQIAWYRHGAGQGENNLGALVWQLNDIWQGYSGDGRLFSPVIIYPSGPPNETLEVLIISDPDMYDWKGQALSTSHHLPDFSSECETRGPMISVYRSNDFTFTLSAKGGVAPWTWVDHPAGTVGVFMDAKTGLPSNGFYLVPGIDRTRQYAYFCTTIMMLTDYLVRFELNAALSSVKHPNAEDFVVKSLWNNTHI
ncbi:glycoside hydrolase superfamily [Flammula alnicola]|nr:glycoside hydrolase superfamily [Flammula alnicola]